MAKHKRTREEYLAGSLSRLKPWEAEGVSRRTYYRRRDAVTGTSAPVGTGPRSGTGSLDGTSPPGTSAQVGTGPHAGKGAQAGRAAASKIILPASLLGEKLRLIRAVDDALVAQGQKTLSKRTNLSTLRAPYCTMKLGALSKAYDRAVESVPAGYNRWVALVRLWGGRRWDSSPKAAREFVDDLIVLAGAHRAARLGDLFARLDRQWGDGRAKFNRLLKYRDGMKADPLFWPRTGHPAKRSDANAAAVRRIMEADPTRFWTVSELARRLRASPKAMVHLTGTMRSRGEIVWADVGRSRLGLPRRGRSENLVRN